MSDTASLWLLLIGVFLLGVSLGGYVQERIAKKSRAVVTDSTGHTGLLLTTTGEETFRVVSMPQHVQPNDLLVVFVTKTEDQEELP